MVNENLDGSFEDYYNLFINGQTVNGAWWDHINGFVKLKNVLLISYEDLIEVRIGLKSVYKTLFICIVYTKRTHLIKFKD